ncbi:MAG: SDR family oxidoreductase [Bacteroidota bacterium]
MSVIRNKNVLITGGAGFIGSNLCEDMLQYKNKVICLDNFSTGHRSNLDAIIDHPDFTLVEGDIRDINTCMQASASADIILHQAALGSVPRSLKDPVSTNEVNVSGFLNMLIAARDQKVKRFVYAASSSTYGDSEKLPKKEDEIGKPLSPYAVTKYTNELYAHVFGLHFGMECIGLRYFNVFGKRQDPNSTYAAVIPKFVYSLIHHISPVINGDGSYSRDFTYIKNVIQMNHLAGSTENPEAIGEVFNTAAGERSSLNKLTGLLKKYLIQYDKSIADVEVKHGPTRAGDIPHTLASIDKAADMLNYRPAHNLEEGLQEAVGWYYKHLK